MRELSSTEILTVAGGRQPSHGCSIFAPSLTVEEIEEVCAELAGEPVAFDSLEGDSLEGYVESADGGNTITPGRLPR
jgi:hypothetical protein